MVGHEVDDDPQAEVVGPGDHRVGVVEGPEERVDVTVVGDVVAGVALRRAVEGGEPHGIDAQVAQVLQPRGDARQVTDTVARGVGPRARVDLVDHGIAPPRGVGGIGGVELAGHRRCPSSSALIIMSAARVKYWRIAASCASGRSSVSIAASMCRIHRSRMSGVTA